MMFSKLMKLTVDRMTEDNWILGALVGGRSGCSRCALGHMAAVLNLPVQTIDGDDDYRAIEDALGPIMVEGVYDINDRYVPAGTSKEEALARVKAELLELAKNNDFEVRLPE